LCSLFNKSLFLSNLYLLLKYVTKQKYIHFELSSLWVVIFKKHKGDIFLAGTVCARFACVRMTSTVHTYIYWDTIPAGTCTCYYCLTKNQNTNISVTSSDHPMTKPGLRNIQRNTHVKNNVATPYSWKVMGPKFLYLSCITWECIITCQNKFSTNEFKITFHNFGILFCNCNGNVVILILVRITNLYYFYHYFSYFENIYDVFLYI